MLVTTQAASTLAFGPAGISANVGRVPQGNNVILDTTNDEDKWRELDMQVRAACGACREDRRAPVECWLARSVRMWNVGRCAQYSLVNPPRPQVNEYPGQRTFKAIGTGDQDFVVRAGAHPSCSCAAGPGWGTRVMLSWLRLQPVAAGTVGVQRWVPCSGTFVVSLERKLQE